jgi:hypothetical protein
MAKLPSGDGLTVPVSRRSTQRWVYSDSVRDVLFLFGYLAGLRTPTFPACFRIKIFTVASAR